MSSSLFDVACRFLEWDRFGDAYMVMLGGCAQASDTFSADELRVMAMINLMSCGESS